jgi:CheY-like chemotaxis protein
MISFKPCPITNCKVNMSQFTPDSYQILIVEDCPIWRRELESMYSRRLFGEVRPCQNIFLAATAEEAVNIMQKRPQQFNLVSLDINLGSRNSLGLGNGKSEVAVNGLDVLDQMQKLQRGAAVVVITGASSDSELPSAFTAEEKDKGEARAKITLASELQELFQDAYRYFPKALVDQSSTEVENAAIKKRISIIEEKLTQATLFSLSEKREEQLIKVEVPSLCVMIVLDDT